MRYAKIRKMDISNGPGGRVSILMQGCAFHCPNYFNPETHDYQGGNEFNEQTIQKVLFLAESDNIVGLSILGGEPMHPANIQGTCALSKAFKEKYPNAYKTFMEDYFNEAPDTAPTGKSYPQSLAGKRDAVLGANY